MAEIGVKHPNGKFYRFENGEKFAQIQIPDIPGERVAIIIEKDGRKRLFESWMLEQDQKAEAN